MRKLFVTISILAFSATAGMAQSEWERPEDARSLSDTTTISRKAIKEAEKAERQAEKARLAKEEAKYLSGAVSEKDGKVEWSRDYPVASASAEELYTKMLSVLQKFTKQKGQLPQSAVTLLNKKEHVVVASVWEWLVFKDTFLSLDKAKFNYILVARCSDGNVNLSLQKLRYVYDEMTGKGEETILAEEAINDKNALNKKKTKLVPGWAKFRKKTVDRANEVFSALAAELK